ncbi:glycosyltransferase [Podospora fimiseda]|uniref:GPI mannosyltransferase 2 n=1 Tax=Podospora fimiseda TaxID=252190 RepID=A0AAN7GZ42_9PEZI|nr:glycosyltransferase [Podospora fimiseda]
MTKDNPQPSNPYLTILKTFLSWKTFLFSIALGSALLTGDAYDTSGSLVVFPAHQGSGAGGTIINPTEAAVSEASGQQQPQGFFLSRVAARFTSWDAIYFVTQAKRGYLFEQEWAFGAGLPSLIRGLLYILRSLGVFTEAEGKDVGALYEALAGVFLANVAHLLSAFVLYRLGCLVLGGPKKISLVAAVLHVFSPAGLFLSAPYAESSFALLSFSGYLVFALSCGVNDQKPFYRDSGLILSGILFGLATGFRSNGILNGIPFAWEVIRHLPSFWERPVDMIRRMIALGVGGVCVAVGSAIPQAVAYRQLCSSDGSCGVGDLRPWCQSMVPSIYTFVQEHYCCFFSPRNTGFLRYWTLSNIPLFLLAAPMLVILTKSGVDQLTSSDRKFLETGSSSQLFAFVQSLAVIQVVLSVLAITMYHVQIITRISSGYPLWYWWVAGSLCRGEKTASHIVKFMIIYASIQGVLFTSFLPPA